MRILLALPSRVLLLRAALAASALAWPLASEAASILYTTRSAWEAAVTSWTTEDFESLAVQTVSHSGGTIGAHGFDIVIPENHGGIGIRDGRSIDGTRGFVGDVHSPSIDPPHFNRLEFRQALHGFAVDVGEVEDDLPLDLLIGGETFRVDGGSFFGVVSSQRFATVEVRGSRSFYDLDNVAFAVPEPSGAALFAAGLLVLRGGQRRRRGSGARTGVGEPGSAPAGISPR